MRALRIPRSPRIVLTVTERLMLGLLPSWLALALVAGLGYWGEYGRAVPQRVVAGAAVLGVVSFIVTWLNAGYLNRRIHRLAQGTRAEGTTVDGSPRADHVRSADGPSDELDRIEGVISSLGSSLALATAQRVQVEEAVRLRLREQSGVLEATVRDALARLDEVRLPLHILLENRFGELNDNQEELLRDARLAADAMDAALRQLGQVAAVDGGTLPVRSELVRVNDVVRGVLPVARAVAESHGVSLDVVLDPTLARVQGDHPALAEALALLLNTTIAGHAGGTVRVLTQRAGTSAVQIRITGTETPATVAAPSIAAPSTAAPSMAGRTFATRLIEVQGGTVACDGGSITITMKGP